MAQERAAQQREEIRGRYTRRMHDLSEFMKALLERFTKWFNRRHSRSGTLWEDRFKSVIVESGVAARTMAAYIDLNCRRAQKRDRAAVRAAIVVMKRVNASGAKGGRKVERQKP